MCKDLALLTPLCKSSAFIRHDCDKRSIHSSRVYEVKNPQNVRYSYTSYAERVVINYQCWNLMCLILVRTSFIPAAVEVWLFQVFHLIVGSLLSLIRPEGNAPLRTSCMASTVSERVFLAYRCTDCCFYTNAIVRESHLPQTLYVVVSCGWAR